MLQTIACFFVIIITSCSGKNVRTDIDTANSGLIHISVDESFKPIIDSQIQVFEATFPKAKIMVEYKPEAECLRDLIKDSTRMIIVTRGLLREEEAFYKDSIKFVPRWDKVANDAIALIVNNKSTDTTITMAKLRGLLEGNTGDKEKIVFDGLSATSTVRFVKDSILKGKEFSTKNVFAAKSSQEVIDYIAANNGAIGLVGVSWIGNKEDTAQLSFLKKVKIVAVECVACDGTPYIKPYQANIVTKRYPLVRGLYYIVKENYDGLGGGFADWLTYEKGQLIFWRGYLGPTKMKLTVRDATLN
ncbi:MAG: substrate-binding domain-containing protein [Chitinophagaceae bacterium]